MSTGRFLEPASLEAATTDGETLATIGGIPAWVPDSRPVILLPAGSTAADVPAGTPIGTIVLVKA